MGGGIHAWDNYASISGVNNIVYYNTADVDPEAFGTLEFTYTCISTGLPGVGNIIDVTMFTDTTSGDVTLQEYSPCIDTGDPESPLDPDSTRADMGALYYHQYSGIEDNPKQVAPAEFALLPNYPNPFNPETRLTFAVPSTSQVTLTIFNITGRQVGTVVDGWVHAGTHRYVWDAKGLPSGIYFARLAVSGKYQLQKLILIK